MPWQGRKHSHNYSTLLYTNQKGISMKKYELIFYFEDSTVFECEVRAEKMAIAVTTANETENRFFLCKGYNLREIKEDK